MAVTKKEADGNHPSSHYLVVEDPEMPSTWHLRVKDADGKLDHRLMGAAWAALHAGYRGNRYEGPGKQEAVAKLKRLYESEGLELPSEQASDLPRFITALSEHPGALRIPLAVTGTWHRGDRQFSITREQLEEAILNFEKKLNGEINVDYDHASEMPEVAAGGPVPSAGRIVQLEPPQRLADGRWILWGHYEPTQRARELIRNREYRYISPAIDWGARSKQTGERQGTTITSVALTNRPFLEEMPEIHLSDPSYRLVDTGSVHVDSALPNFSVAARQGATTEEKTMAKKLSISPITEGEHKGHHAVHDGEEMLGYVTHGEAKKSVAAQDDDGDELSELMSEAGAATIAELRGKVRSAGERAKQETVRSLLLSEAVNEKGVLLAEKLDRLVESGRVEFADCRRFERAAQAVEDGVRSGKIAPATRRFFLSAAIADPDGFRAFLGAAPPVVDLAERGIAGSENDADVRHRVKALAEDLMREKKVTMREALNEISREHPDLVNQYRKAVTGSQAIQ
jgi:phage I-like protein